MTRTIYTINAEDARGGMPDDATLAQEFETLEAAKLAAWEYVHGFDDGQRRFFSVYISKMEVDDDGSGSGHGVCTIDTETGEPIE
jgi:hypothetical protein